MQREQRDTTTARQYDQRQHRHRDQSPFQRSQVETPDRREHAPRLQFAMVELDAPVAPRQQLWIVLFRQTARFIGDLDPHRGVAHDLAPFDDGGNGRLNPVMRPILAAILDDS